MNVLHGFDLNWFELTYCETLAVRIDCCICLYTSSYRIRWVNVVYKRRPVCQKSTVQFDTEPHLSELPLYVVARTVHVL